MSIIQRIKALERVKKVNQLPPLIIFMPDDELTDEQQRQVNEAEAIGQNVIMIMRDTHDPNLNP